VPGMATHERVTLVCDGCGVEDDTVRTVTLRRDRKKARYVEACPTCLAPVDALIAAGRTDPTPPVTSGG
jgi:hypothetical protein